jgi:hypothetical protein
MKTLRTDYTFDASEKTITFANPITKVGLLLVTNVVAGTIIYSFADPTKGGDIVANVLTLMYDTTGMIDANELQIFWDNGPNDYNYIQSDEDATYKYYGYMSSGGWRIKRKTLATNVWEVSTGLGDYDTAWADRDNKTYSYI